MTGDWLAALREGKPIMIYDNDDREAETDFVTASEFVTPVTIRTMRKEAGGLICTTVPPEVHRKIGLPYMEDVLAAARDEFPLIAELRADDVRYDTRSAFALTVNHRTTFTGITDRDRATTIQAFSRFCQADVNGGSVKLFGSEFRSPGHVHLLNAAEKLMAVRRGHTELATAACQLAGLSGSATICEMMRDDGKALSPTEAAAYAAEREIPFVSGDEIIEVWTSRQSA